MDGQPNRRSGDANSEKVKNKKKKKKLKDDEASRLGSVVTNEIGIPRNLKNNPDKTRKRLPDANEKGEQEANGLINSLKSATNSKKKKKIKPSDVDLLLQNCSSPLTKSSKNVPPLTPNLTSLPNRDSPAGSVVSKIPETKKKFKKAKIAAIVKEPIVTLGVATPHKSVGAKKKKQKDEDKLKQITLAESFLGKTPRKSKEIKASGSPSEVATEAAPPSRVEEPLKNSASEPAKSKRKRKVKEKIESNKVLTNPSNSSPLPILTKSENKKDKVKEKTRKKATSPKKKKVKMDVVEKANNNNDQKFNFGQTIDISDNSSDSTELKIATNDDDDDSSELSSEYDSSDSEHIMKSIKSFNKKGASKSVSKKDEPPPPKVKPKIYSSSEEGEDFKEEDDAEEDDNEEKDDENPNVDSPTDGDNLPKAVSDTEDMFFNGWTKADVQQLLSRIQSEIPNNDNIKASTRVKQLNWEKIKFASYTAENCLEKWKSIEKKIRGFRILEELLIDAQKWLEQPWTNFYKGNRKKQQRHPEMPKKPLTSYMIFYLKKKEKIAKEFPSISLTDLSKVIAERFNKLAPNKKAKYNEMALAMKEEYVTKMKKFAESHPAEMARMFNNSGKSKRGTSIIMMPGWSGGFKPVPPLKLFLEDKIKQHNSDPNANLPELIAEYKERWKSLTSKKKLPWIRWAYEAELKYLEELKAYQAENPAFVIPKHKSVLLKDERNILEKMQGKPDKPPPSAYLLFSSVMLKDPNLRNLTPKERMQEAARLWKNVPKVEKDGYAEKVKHLANIYKLEYASWLESLPEDKRKEEMANVGPKRRTKTLDRLPKAKRARVDSKSKPAKPVLSLEDILKLEPPSPPKNAYAMFCQEYKDYPEKEIKKSWDALLEAPKAKLEAAVEKQKQQYILDFRKFLKNLAPEDLKMYSAYKASHNTKIDVKLIDSEDSNEEDGDEEEDDDGEEEGEDEEEEEEEEELPNNKARNPRLLAQDAKTPVSQATPGGQKVNAEESSDDSEDDEEKPAQKGGAKSSSSSSSSESSSDEEEGSSSSSTSSSSSEEDNNAF